MLAYNVADIEGIGPKLCIKLEKVSIKTVEDLLMSCSTPQGRREVSLKTGISEAKLLKWVNMIDLFRVDGIGIEHSELLEASGVEAINQLRSTDAEKLHERMIRVNSSKRFVLQVPSLSEIQNYIRNAQEVHPLVMN